MKKEAQSRPQGVMTLNGLNIHYLHYQTKKVHDIYFYEVVGVISGGKGNAQDKIEKMKSSGIKISDSPAGLGKTLQTELER